MEEFREGITGRPIQTPEEELEKQIAKQAAAGTVQKQLEKARKALETARKKLTKKPAAKAV